VLPGTVVALERRTWLPRPGADANWFGPELFDAVRATDDPYEVDLDFEAPECIDPYVAGSWRAGEVLIVRVDGRERAVCDDDEWVPRTLRARFDQPVGSRAVLPLPLLRPRPAEGVRVKPWSTARVASTDGRTVAVEWTNGIPRCSAFAGLEADEGPRSVRLTLKVGRPVGRDTDRCIFLGLLTTAVVRLSEPVGARRLVHGP
jgi:hypothetical protein